MKFAQIFAVAAATLGAVNAQTLTAAKTVADINDLTAMSKSPIDKDAKNITLVNGFQNGPVLIRDLHEFVKKGTQYYNAISGGNNKREFSGSMAAQAAVEARATKYTAAEQKEICTSFSNFVKAHQAALATIIGKHGILEVTGIAYQTAAVLRGVEGVIDEIAFTVLGFVPTCASTFQTDKKNLDKSLQSAIDTYANGLP